VVADRAGVDTRRRGEGELRAEREHLRGVMPKRSWSRMPNTAIALAAYSGSVSVPTTVTSRSPST
jgi:hypothetical protein